MNPEEIRVSVAMPVFNGAKMFGRALDSMLAQTHRNLEVIISDNCSTDETSAIATERAGRDSRIRYIRRPENVGARRNLLDVVLETTGQYVLIAGDDDYWEPTFLSKLLQALAGREFAGIAQSAIRRVNSYGETVDILNLNEHVAPATSGTSPRGAKNSRRRLRQLLFTKKERGGHNPFNVIVLSLLCGDTIRQSFRDFPADLSDDRAWPAAVVAAHDWVFVDEVLMTKISYHSRPFQERRAAADGTPDPLVANRDRFSKNRRRLKILNFLMYTSALSLARKLAVVFPLYFSLLWQVVWDHAMRLRHRVDTRAEL